MNADVQIRQESQTPPAAAAAPHHGLRRHLTSMAIKVQIHDRLAHIAVSGRFDFQMSRDFRNSYTPLLGNADVQEICVEMSKVDYLDSSAMGMLLLLNERAKEARKSVTLFTTSGVVSQVLEVANFSKIFNIKHIKPGAVACQNARC